MINFLQYKKIFCQAAILCSCLFIYSCENDVNEVNKWNTKKVMVDEIYNVQTIYSQSGDLKAKLKAPLMMHYQADTSFWEFPKSLHVYFFDSSGKKESELDAFYGKWFESLNRILLRDSVIVSNIKGDTLRTPELWWDQNTRKFYTDSVVHLRMPDKTIIGKGMQADQDLNNISIFKTTGIVLMEEGEGF